jgi:hypothetical protein
MHRGRTVIGVWVDPLSVQGYNEAVKTTMKPPQLDPGGSALDNEPPGRKDSPPCMPETGIRIKGIGVQPFPDGRRLDVAVDLTPFLPSRPEQDRLGVAAGPRLELAVESPTGSHVCSVTLVECRKRAVDLVMHLRGHPEPGEYRLHVGLFWNEALLHHEQRTFSLPAAMTQG